MFEFISRLFGRQPEAVAAPDPTITGVRLYWRDNGPIAYEARVFADPAAGGALRADLPEQLLASGLAWFWESARYSDEYPPVDASLPKRRQLTELTADSAPALGADLREHTAGCPRSFTLFGAEPGAAEALLNPRERQRQLEEFSASEAGPLRMVINQEGEVDWEVVFVSHNTSPAVDNLLAGWGIEKATIVRTFQDRETNGIFESTFGLPQRRAQG